MRQRAVRATEREGATFDVLTVFSMHAERPIWLGILILLLARFLMAFSFDLAAEEAFWANASTRLAPHFPIGGPVPAVMTWIGTSLFGASEFGVRFGVILLGGASALCFYRLVRSTLDGGAAVWAVLALLVCPFYHLGSVLLTAVGVAVHLSMIAAYLLWLALLRSKTSRGWWAAAGVVFGLALLSHPIALIPIFSAVAALCTIRRWRARWTSLGPWLMMVLCLGCALPSLLWLLRSPEGQPVGVALLEEFRDPHSLRPPELAGRLIEVLLGFSPLLLVGAASASAFGIREHLRTRDYGSLYLTAFALPGLLIGLALTLESRTGALWLAPGIAFGIALLAGQWPQQIRGRSLRILLRTLALFVGALLCLAASAPDVLRSLRIPLEEKVANVPEIETREDLEKRELPDPSLALRGWGTLGGLLDDVTSSITEELDGERPFLLADGWKTAAEAEFYLSEPFAGHRASLDYPLVQPIVDFGTPGTYSAWPSYAAIRGGNEGATESYLGRHALLIIDTSRMNGPPQRIRDAFERVEKVSEGIIGHGRVSLRRIEIHACLRYLGESP